MNTSTPDTEPLVFRSSDLNIVWPTRFCGSPLPITSATITSLRINSELDGLIKFVSKSIIFDSTPYNTLNNILIDSSIPFDW